MISILKYKRKKMDYIFVNELSKKIEILSHSVVTFINEKLSELGLLDVNFNKCYYRSDKIVRNEKRILYPENDIGDFYICSKTNPDDLYIRIEVIFDISDPDFVSIQIKELLWESVIEDYLSMRMQKVLYTECSKISHTKEEDFVGSFCEMIEKYVKSSVILKSSFITRNKELENLN